MNNSLAKRSASWVLLGAAAGLAAVSTYSLAVPKMPKVAFGVEVVDFEVEADGTPVYEYDIKMADGQDIRVEVDAITGKLHQAHLELVEIGRIPQ